MCGEKIRAVSATTASVESPPRVRGKDIRACPGAAFCGITPACAGKRTMRAASRSTTWDYPRVCGEKLEPKDYDDPEKGSPPRVRGKAERYGCRKGGSGITPACAGKSYVCVKIRVHREDHPRVCGEKCLMLHPERRAVGSPPRVRGKASSRSRWTGNRRITPACAGKRKISSNRHLGKWDHPRVCGEKTELFSHATTELGSPPRVRGKDRDIARSRHAVGITPACAGKSLSESCRAVQGQDHPRVCGEK